VHEYGGGGYVALADSNVLFTDFNSKPHAHRLRVYCGATKSILTLDTSAACRFGDFFKHPVLNLVYCVREDHTDPSPHGVLTDLVIIDLSAVDFAGADPSTPILAPLTPIVCGRDFYTSPAVSPDGLSLAFVSWSHPQMPWDVTDLVTLTLDESTGLPTSTATLVKTSSSNYAPLYSSSPSSSSSSSSSPLSSSTLHWLSDEHNFYGVHKVTDASSEPPTSSRVPVPQPPGMPKDDLDISSYGQGWQLGKRSFCFYEGNTIVALYHFIDSGEYGIVVVFDDDTAPLYMSKATLGVDEISEFIVGADNKLYFFGGSYDTPEGLYQLDLPNLVASHRGRTHASASPSLIFSPWVEDENGSRLRALTPSFSQPKHYLIPGPHGVFHAYYYPPSTSAGVGALPPSSPPPLLVKAHGGPTAETSTVFRLDIQYWCVRGFSVLDVDYGGSSGYGRDYRNRLKGNWGVVDRDDVVAGARFCTTQGLADSKCVAIDGGSAGGYTTLCALTFCEGVFTAGASKYGISDLGALYEETHKFESKYMDGLIGKYPECKELYDSRCPIKYVHQLNCPILLLQGCEDKVVPPNQSLLFYEKALEKGLPTQLVLYEGEQHGFRNPKNIEHALELEYGFFCKVWNIECGPEVERLVRLGEKVVM
jgi:dipeptidyl aminopeptidase/acylaminoacyl peptidase